MISKFSYILTLDWKFNSLNKPKKYLTKGKFSVAVNDKIVNENDQMLLESIFLKILNINTDVNAGKKQKPRKSLNDSELIKLSI